MTYGHKKNVFLEQNNSIRSIHASFHNFHNVSIYIKWWQKLVMGNIIWGKWTLFMSQYDWIEQVLAPMQAWALHPMVIWDPWNSNRIQYESTNQEWERWPKVWMSAMLNARYYYTPSPGACIAFS